MELRNRFAVLSPETFRMLRPRDEIWALPEGQEPSMDANYRKAVVLHWNKEETGVVVRFIETQSGKRNLLVTAHNRLARLTDNHIPRRQDWMSEDHPHP